MKNEKKIFTKALIALNVGIYPEHKIDMVFKLNADTFKPEITTTFTYLPTKICSEIFMVNDLT
jgi:hypothetical protein